LFHLLILVCGTQLRLIDCLTLLVNGDADHHEQHTNHVNNAGYLLKDDGTDDLFGSGQKCKKKSEGLAR
jgi:hypothetical protein